MSNLSQRALRYRSRSLRSIERENQNLIRENQILRETLYQTSLNLNNYIDFAEMITACIDFHELNLEMYNFRNLINRNE